MPIGCRLYLAGTLTFSKTIHLRRPVGDRTGQLAWPIAKEFAVAFYKCLPLKLRKLLAELIPLDLPHSRHCGRSGRPETIYQSRMMGEVLFELGPAKSRCILHVKPVPGIESCIASPLFPPPLVSHVEIVAC